MGISYPKRARPILSEHDYDAIKALLDSGEARGAAAQPGERIDALAREIKDYERRDEQRDPASVAAWSEFVMVPMLDEEMRPRRRRSDLREPVAHPLTDALLGLKRSINRA